MRGHGRKSISPNTRGPARRKATASPSHPPRSHMVKGGPKKPRIRRKGTKS